MSLLDSLKKPYINITALERAIGCPRGTVEQWIAGRRKLPIKWERAIRNEFNEIGSP